MGPEETSLQALRAHVQRGGLVDLRAGPLPDPKAHDHARCPGYIHHHPKRGLEYLLPEATFEAVLGGSAAANRLKSAQAARGWLDTAAGAGGRRYSVRRTIGRSGGKGLRVQVVAISAAALGRPAGRPRLFAGCDPRDHEEGESTAVLDGGSGRRRMSRGDMATSPRPDAAA